MRGSKRLAAVALVLWGAGMLISSVVPWQSLNDGRSALNEMRQVAATVGDKNQPRIFLMGSSPVVLGLSANHITEATGLRTYNIAAPTTANFFPEYLQATLEFVRPGDVVVISDPNWLSRGNPTLGEGCVEKFSFACALWRPRPLPNLVEFAKVVTGLARTDFGIARNEIGDAVSVRSVNGAASIPPLNFVGRYADDVVLQLRRIVEAVRAKGACPLLALGPIYVSATEAGQWQHEQARTEARLAKLGLARSVLTNGAISTDRAMFLDNFEHPSESERALWSDRIVERLVNQSQSPCAGSMAKADRIPNDSDAAVQPQ